MDQAVPWDTICFPLKSQKAACLEYPAFRVGGGGGGLELKLSDVPVDHPSEERVGAELKT